VPAQTWTVSPAAAAVTADWMSLKPGSAQLVFAANRNVVVHPLRVGQRRAGERCGDANQRDRKRQRATDDAKDHSHLLVPVLRPAPGGRIAACARSALRSGDVSETVGIDAVSPPQSSDM
jgi:hypothetical protein